MPAIACKDRPASVAPRTRLYLGLAGAGVLVLVVLALILAVRKHRRTADEPTPEERQLAVLSSAARVRERLPDLRADPALGRAARAHAQAMARTKRLSLPEDEDLRKQLGRAGYPCDRWGAAIDLMPALDLPTAFDQAMKQDAIRLVLLDRHYGEIGVGIVQDDDGFFYLVQLFGQRK